MQFLYDVKLKKLQEQLSSNELTIKILKDQQAILNQRHDLLTSKLPAYRNAMESGHMSHQQYDNYYSQSLQFQTEIKDNLKAQNNIIQSNTQLFIDISALPKQLENERAGIKGQLSDIQVKVVQLQSQKSYVVTAPVSGVVNNLQVFLGQQVSSSTPALTIFPKDYENRVTLVVPVRSAGFLKTELPLQIRFDAFPYQKFGLYRGYVTEVSETILLPNEIQNSPLQLSEPVYRIQAKLEQQNVEAYGQTFSLKPGMTLSADISMSSRSIMEWLFEPLLSLKGRI